ncbi:hypothetical protein QYH69_29465 [Paraburkholderia sp. SARCC-3016]|nr:hypothetical protein [Paraburkholderia sp. SARCC-3016]MDQ7981365.1 hypothetical protein [Paraburkholderia sp. SARCC-3016]
MSCCNPHRERIDLSCDVNQQLACAATALTWSAEYAPDDVVRLIASLIRTFPEHLALVRDACVLAAVIGAFVERVALHCAALPTKTERHVCRGQFANGLSAADLQRFDDLMAVEWRRLRSK